MFKTLVFCDIIQSMKSRILIFSSLLSLCGALPVLASECVGAGCDVEPMNIPTVSEPTVLGAPQVISYDAPVATATDYTITNYAMTGYAQPVKQNYAIQPPMREVKLLSIKPVPADNRAPVWDGTTGEYETRGFDKTVDWRDGVPIWDDSISSYKYKDFTDWFLQPIPEIYIREVDEVSTTPYAYGSMAQENFDIMGLYRQNMADAAATRARVEKLLSPQEPSDNIWGCTDEEISEQVVLPAPRPEYVAQDLTEVINITFGRADGCPFESETECEIWRRKPIVRETVSPRSPKLRADKMIAFIKAAVCNENITANESVSAPLLERYKILMSSAQACCTDGMAYALKKAGASDGLVYKFLADDANFYGFGTRCLMTTDKELDTKYPNTATASVVADVRNGCLCRGRQWFEAMLAPFKELYKTMPEFKDYKFNYTYTDGLQREITVSVNTDVQNVLNQLALCP